MWYQFFTCKHQMCGSTHSSTSSSSGVDHEDVYDNLSPVEDPSVVASSTSTYRTHGLLCDVGRHAVSVHTDNVLRSSISLQTGPYRHKLQTVVQWLVSHKTCIPWQRASRLRPVIAPNVHSCLFIWTPSVHGATQPFQWTVCSCDQHTRSQRCERSQIFVISAPQQAPLAPLHHIVTQQKWNSNYIFRNCRLIVNVGPDTIDYMKLIHITITADERSMLIADLSVKR